MKETVVFVTNSKVGARVDRMKWGRIVFTSNFVTTQTYFLTVLAYD